MLKSLALVSILAPLLGSVVSGLFAKRIGKVGAHVVTIALMLVSVIAAFVLAYHVIHLGQHYYGSVYTWAASGRFHFDIGFLLDPLTVVMMVVVSFVSMLIHVYSIGYMRDDLGDQRFFCYISLFTFMMLMLVTANNFLQLFFGWEGVGLVSYLLIGFWFERESAAQGAFKAFIVNRVGDFGFLLGIAAIMDYVGSLDYHTVFAKAASLAHQHVSLFSGVHWSLDTVICILLFIGAMGKSAQVPLHVWLPESMEGPTPISALIHAATMVTAGIFMVARMSPLFELSIPAMSLVLFIGATGALYLGLLAFVEFDIKRVIAYSTMSQLGYMMAANGAGAFSAGIFHLVTHAFFKALLFLGAGSVIVALHHERDLRNMGGLRKHLPVTYLCFLIGACALAAIPPFSGFYSKDAIIEAVHLSSIPGAHYAYWCLVVGAFVTAYYIFRALFLAFHGQQRFAAHGEVKEQWVMLWPMILLAIPSVVLGFLFIKPFLFAAKPILANSIVVSSRLNVLTKLSSSFHGAWSYAAHGLLTLPFWLVVFGIVMAWVNTIAAPQFPAWLKQKLSWLHVILVEKYGFDRLNDFVFARGSKRLSRFLFRFADIKVIDDLMVNGSGRNVARLARMVKSFQTGYLYHYVLVMMVGLIALLIWMVF